MVQRLVAGWAITVVAGGCGIATRQQRDATTYAIVGAAVLAGLVIGIASNHNPEPVMMRPPLQHLDRSR